MKNKSFVLFVSILSAFLISAGQVILKVGETIENAIDPTEMQGNMSKWRAETPPYRGTGEGFIWVGSVTENTATAKCSDDNSKTYSRRLKLNPVTEANPESNYIQLPALTNVGVVKVYLGSGTSGYSTLGDVAHTLVLEKLSGNGNWELLQTISVALPSASASACRAATFGLDKFNEESELSGISEDPVILRIRNTTNITITSLPNGDPISFGNSLWLYEILATSYGDDGTPKSPAGEVVPYSFKDDMPANVKRVVVPASGTPWESELVKINDGKLVYNKDANGFIIPNFSHAGYKNGDVPIPQVAVVKTINPVANADNTALIQAAIDEVGKMPLDANGIRGALLLTKGLYIVKGPIYVNYDGVVIRGEGNLGDPANATIIYDNHRDATAKSGRSIFILGNKTQDNWSSGKNNEESVLDDVVEVGSYTFKIKKNENYKAGDLICIDHPCTEAWAIAVDRGASTSSPWKEGSVPVSYHRYVKEVKHTSTETEITIDAPVFETLRKSLSQCKVSRFNRIAMQNIGIENLRIDIGAKAIPDENHAWQCVYFKNVENGWAKDVVTLHFGQSGFITERTTRTTIENCYALDPVGEITGERMYNFNTYAMSQLVLFKNCYARGGRHNYISNGTSKTSGCVVYNCKSEGSRASSEGHRLWTQGMLFDSYEDFDPYKSGSTFAVLGFYSRNDMGSGHGWAMSHGVMWNCNVNTDQSKAVNGNTSSRIYCEKPPTSQNYAIGCITRETQGVRVYTKTLGYVEGTNKSGLQPSSLYAAQLNERLHGTITSIDATAKVKETVFVYPNPVQDVLYVQASQPVKFIRIFDITGRMTLDLPYQDKGISLLGLPKGIYMVQIETESGVSTCKIRKE